jgi:hypothetical protein
MIETFRRYIPVSEKTFRIPTGKALQFHNSRVQFLKRCPRQDLNLRNESDSLGNPDGNAQIDAQILVALEHDLSQVVTAWAKLPTPLKAAVLAIINSTESKP